MSSLSLKGAQLLGRMPQIYTVATQHCDYSSEVRPRELNTASMKRGRGGRSSFSGDVVTVFGANGFIGRGVANRLGKNGSQMIFPYRGEHYKMMRLKVVGDLGQVLFTPIELNDEDSIRRAISHSNIVINLIGRNFETKNFSFEDVNIKGPQTIARLCKEAGVQRLVHLSHINARENPEVAFLPGGSRFLKSKYQGELAVRAEFPEATIFRPSDVYGQGDNFINYWMSIFRNKRFRLSLYGKGELSVKQPIWMTDLATGIMNSLHDPEAIGETYEAVGPERLTQAELMTYMYALTTRNQEDGTFGITELMFDPKTIMKSWVCGKMPFGNLNVFHKSSLDRLESEAISDLSDGYPDMAESLGVDLHTLAQKLPWEVEPFDLHRYYHYETVEEKPVIPPPKTLSMEEERKLLGIRKQLGILQVLPGAVAAI